MGLLTNPNSNSDGGLMSFLERQHLRLAWLCYVIGVAGIFVFPHPEFSHKTYFSENALLPGLVRGEFNDERAIMAYLDDLKTEAKKYPSSVPFPWLKASLTQLGLEVYSHNFTLNYPLSKDNANYTGENVYAILRAPRASSTEALVLSVPYRSPNSPEHGTDTSIAVLLGTAKFFRKQYYWAKDIIFLVTQHEQLGMQAWLEAYHQKSCGDGILDHGDLPARAGSIQAAINLEIADPSMTHFNLKVEGLNGQLPNLDLVNLINRLCAREGVGQMFQNVEDHPRPDTWRGYKRSLTTLLTMAMKQATGVPTGNHGLFHRFGIEALTIEGVRQKSRKRQDVTLHTIGRVVEGVFRSLNNLLERLHQSFFFYLLPSSSRYVSIGMYMPAFGFLGGALVLASLGTYLQCTREEQVVRAKELEEKNKDEKKGKEGDEEIVTLPVVIPASSAKVLLMVLFAHLVGFLMSMLPTRMAKFGALMELESDDAIALGVVSFAFCTLFMPSYVRGDNWLTLKCVALLELAALAFVASLCNFGLAYFVALVYVPLALISGGNHKESYFATYLFKLSFSMLANPVALLAAVCTADTFYNFGAEKPLERLIIMSVDATKRALTFAVTDGMVYGNVNFKMTCILLVPIWHLFWSQNFINFDKKLDDIVEDEGEDDKDTESKKDK